MRNARGTRNIIRTQKILYRVAAADGFQNLIVECLRIDGHTRNAVLLCNLKFLLGDGVGTARLQRKFRKRCDIDIGRNARQKDIELRFVKRGRRSAANVYGDDASAAFADDAERFVDLAAELDQIIGDQRQQLGRGV